ncbi:MAG: 4Fe-4S double cluster binding domain-containing protein [Actinomycetota bacterium]
MDNLFRNLALMGARAAFLSLNQLSRIQRPYSEYGQRRENLDFFNRYLKKFLMDFTGLMPEAKSILCVAYLQKITEVVFSFKNHKLNTLLPPTYIYRKPEDDIGLALGQATEGTPYKIKEAVLPRKLASAFSGLGEYGKNNLIYIKGMGSFAYLSTYLTSIGCGTSTGSLKALKECQQCTACIDNCPSGSLSVKGFTFKPNRCLTYLNENGGLFPGWLKSSWHNSIVGCMRCQSVCPRNRELVGQIEKGPVFSCRETEAILGGALFKQLSADTRKKLASVCMDDYYSLLARNIRALMDSKLSGS